MPRGEGLESALAEWDPFFAEPLEEEGGLLDQRPASRGRHQQPPSQGHKPKDFYAHSPKQVSRVGVGVRG